MQDLQQACLLALTWSIIVNVYCSIFSVRPWLHKLLTDSVSIEGGVSRKISSRKFYWSCSQGIMSSRVGFNEASTNVTMWNKIRDTLRIIIFTRKDIFHELYHICMQGIMKFLFCVCEQSWDCRICFEF